MLTRARTGGWRCHSDVTIHRDKTGDKVRVTSRTGSARRFVWEFEERESWKLDTKREGSIFVLAGGRRTCALWGLPETGATRDGGRSSWGPNEQDNIEDYVSPPYVETFNSKLIKRFRTWTRSRYVFSNSKIPMFFICSIVINIIYFPNSCIWLRNTRQKISYMVLLEIEQIRSDLYCTPMIDCLLQCWIYHAPAVGSIS